MADEETRLATPEQVEEDLGALGGPEVFASWQFLTLRQKPVLVNKGTVVQHAAGTYYYAEKQEDKKVVTKEMDELRVFVLATRQDRTHFLNSRVDCRSIDGDFPFADNPYSDRCTTCPEATKSYDDGGCPLKASMLVLDIENDMKPAVISFTKGSFAVFGAFKDALAKVAREVGRPHYWFAVTIGAQEVERKGSDSYYIPVFPDEDTLREQGLHAIKADKMDKFVAVRDQYRALRPLFDPAKISRSTVRVAVPGDAVVPAQTTAPTQQTTTSAAPVQPEVAEGEIIDADYDPFESE